MPESTNYEHYPGGASDPEQPPDEPRIYVACLAAYNNGYLHGRWIPAAQELDDLNRAIQAMLADSPIAGAEEYAIHDYDNFGGYQVGEYDDLGTVAGIARGIRQHGPLFGAIAADVGAARLVEQPELFERSYLGSWSSARDYAAELASDIGWDDELAKLPESMQPYVHVNYDQFASDLAHDLTVIDTDDGVAIFDAREL
jgi:antirestriction protein